MTRFLVLAALLTACTPYGRVAAPVGLGLVGTGLVMHETLGPRDQGYAGLTIGLGALYLLATGIVELKHAAHEDRGEDHDFARYNSTSGAPTLVEPDAPTANIPAVFPTPPVATCRFDAQTDTYRTCDVDSITNLCATPFAAACTPT